ncbi:MAG TPA: flavin reductase family protein [Pseudoneobacillus sp.]|nr:flavin reductase family protein [Pseudoneobacillus sp.]
MLSIDPSTLTERENYKLLIGSIIPRPIAFVTTLSTEGVLNGAPFSYFNIVSSNPPSISLAIQRKGGSQKDTARNIVDLKEFVIHIVDETNVEKINETAANLPSNQSEVEKVKLTPVNSIKVKVPGIKEAKVRMECSLRHYLELGNGDCPSTDLIIGKVEHFHIAEEIYEAGKIDPIALGAISRLAGNDYAKIGEIFEIERPK